LTVLCTACGSGTVPEPATTESFLTGLPSRQTLEVSAPSARAPAALTSRSSALLGETAGLYVLTRKASADVNGIVGHTLDALHAIARSPPAAVGPDVAAWGPLSDALSPVAGRLVIRRVAPGAHQFRLDLRPRTAPDSEFETFLLGASTGAGPGGPAEGSFSADLTLAHRLDPVAQPTEGQLVAGWTVAPDQREVHVHLADVLTDSGLASNGDLGALTRADGSGVLAIDAQGDLDGDPATVETGKARSRWLPNGAGRADVEAHGDAGQGMQVTECWDASFGRVYATGIAPDGGVASEGDPNDCVFSEPLR
jgi:hypothetical protein